MRVAVIVLVWNGAKFLNACLQALLEQTGDDCEIIVVDNASTDSSVSVAKAYLPRIGLIQNPVNLGFAGGNNVGIRATTAEVVVLLNQDTVVQPGWLNALRMTFADPSIGIVGCKALYPDKQTIQHAGARVRPGDAFTTHIGQGETDQHQYDQLADMDYVTGAAFAIHRRVLERLGGLDEDFSPAFYEEVDYCYRARRIGFRVIYQPQAVLVHHETTSLPATSYSRTLAFHVNRVRFILRHWDGIAFQAFRRREGAALAATSDARDTAARARSYLIGMLAIPPIARRRQIDPALSGPLAQSDWRWLIQALQSLRELARQRLHDVIAAKTVSVDDSLLNSAPEVRWPGQLDLPAQLVQLERAVHEFKHGVIAQEHVTSLANTPMVGWVVRKIHDFFLHLVLRPHLDPVLDQLLRCAQDLGRQINVASYQMFLLEADEADTTAAIVNLLKSVSEDIVVSESNPVIEIHHPQVNVEELMTLLRERIQRRQPHAVLTQLNESLSGQPGAARLLDSLALQSRLQEVRSRAEDLWVSTTVRDQKLPLFNNLINRLKLTFHELVVIYVNLLAGKQTAYNLSATQLLDELVQAAEQQEQRLRQLQTELETLRHQTGASPLTQPDDGTRQDN